MVEVFKIKKEDLVNFLNYFVLKDELSQTEALWQVDKDQIKVLGVNNTKTLAMRGILKGNFDEWGEIGIDSLLTARNVSKLLKGDEIEITKKRNKLIFSCGNVKLSLVLREPQYILNKLEENKFEELKQKIVGNEFTLTSDQVKDIINYANIFKTNLELAAKDDKVIIRVEENENEIIAALNLDKKLNQEFIVALSGQFISVLDTIKNDVIISAKTDNPVYLKTEVNNVSFEYIIAPIMRED